MRFPASARLPCCVHAPAAIFVLRFPASRPRRRAASPRALMIPAQSTVGHNPPRPPSLRCVATTHGVHTQCRHAPQAWGAKTPSHFYVAPLPPSQSRVASVCILSLRSAARRASLQAASSAAIAAPAQFSRTHRISPAADRVSVYLPAVERPCASRHTRPYLPERAHAADI